MENGGNLKVNAIFEAHLNVQKPSNHADGPTRERFIRDKYERRKFYDPSIFQRLPTSPPVTTASSSAPAPPQLQHQHSMPPLSQPATSGSVGVPSAAARKRLESRRSSFDGSTPSAGREIKSTFSASAKSRAKAPAASQQQQPVGDLLDFDSGFSNKGAQQQQRKNGGSDDFGFPDDPMGPASPTKPLSKKSSGAKSRQQQPQSQRDDFADFALAASNTSNCDFGDFTSAQTSVSSAGNKSSPTSNANHQSSGQKNKGSQQPKNSSSAAQSIMSLYNAGSGHPQAFPTSNDTTSMGMSHMNSPIRTNSSNNNMRNVTGMMQQMSLQNNSGGIHASVLSPHTMQQQALMYQQHMIRLQQMQRQQVAGMMGAVMMPGAPPYGGMGMVNGNSSNLGGGMNNSMSSFGTDAIDFSNSNNNNFQFQSQSMGTGTMMGGKAPSPSNPTHSNNKGRTATAATTNDPFASLSARHGF